MYNIILLFPDLLIAARTRHLVAHNWLVLSIPNYSRITSTKSPSFCMTTFSASLTYLTALLPQSHDYSRYVNRPIWHLHRCDCRNTLIYAHTTSRTLPTCDISLDSITLPESEAGDFWN